MNTNQKGNANLPLMRSITLIYARSFIIAILMAAASVAGILCRSASPEEFWLDWASSSSCGSSSS